MRTAVRADQNPHRRSAPCSFCFPRFVRIQRIGTNPANDSASQPGRYRFQSFPTPEPLSPHRPMPSRSPFQCPVCHVPPNHFYLSSTAIRISRTGEANSGASASQNRDRYGQRMLQSIWQSRRRKMQFRQRGQISRGRWQRTVVAAATRFAAAILLSGWRPFWRSILQRWNWSQSRMGIALFTGRWMQHHENQRREKQPRAAPVDPSCAAVVGACFPRFSR